MVVLNYRDINVTDTRGMEVEGKQAEGYWIEGESYLDQLRSGLGEATAVHSLCLVASKQVQRALAVGDLVDLVPQITRLWLGAGAISGLGRLETLRSLECLHVRGARVDGLPRAMPSLRDLHVETSSEVSLDVLAAYRKLERLHLHSGDPTARMALPAPPSPSRAMPLPSIRELNLTQIRLPRDLRAIGRMSGLHRLTICLCTGWSSCEGLEACRELQQVSIYHEDSELDMHALASLHGVRTYEGVVSELGHLPPRIEELVWLGCAQRALEMERGTMSRLTKLVLENAKSLSGVEGLRLCPTLTHLELKTLPLLTDLACVSALPRLICLELDTCRAEQGCVVGGSTSLTHLSARSQDCGLPPPARGRSTAWVHRHLPSPPPPAVVQPC